MRIRSTFHISVLFMAILVFSMPLVPLAQQASVQAEAIAEAEADAEADVQKNLWLVLGCFFPVLGVVAGYVIAPSPPSSKFLGKPPEYVAFYTDAYQAKSKNIQGRRALIGTGACIGTYMTGCIVLNVLSVSSCLFPLGTIAP